MHWANPPDGKLRKHSPDGKLRQHRKPTAPRKLSSLQCADPRQPHQKSPRPPRAAQLEAQQRPRPPFKGTLQQHD